jgi:ParB-like chromosome segregation protein Spo0J
MQMADKIIMRPVEALIPYARNARTHSEDQVAQIAGSIREFGFTNPILLDGDNGIIAGHGRVLAARSSVIADGAITWSGSWVSMGSGTSLGPF